MAPLTKGERDQMTRIEDRLTSIENRVNKIQHIVIGTAIGIGIAAVVLGMISLKDLFSFAK